MIKIIFFGDITGSPGREAVKKSLPLILSEQKPDLVLANVENLAHGKGVTIKTLEELERMGIQGFTSGNHVFSKRDFTAEVFDKFRHKLVRPANIPDSYPGMSAVKFQTAKGSVLVGNFMGQVFMEKQFHDPITSPFAQVEEWLQLEGAEQCAATFIDFHAEATSEKIAFAYVLEGKVSAVVCTHTHVATADAKILPGGTAYITDVGMCGAAGSVLGVKKELSIERFVSNAWVPFDIPEDAGQAELSYVIIEVDEVTHKATAIQSVHKVIDL